MNSAPFSVLVTGLLRTPDTLRRSLREWNAMRDRGLISRTIMVTWTSEAEREPDLVAELEDAGLEMIVRPDPKIRGIGNVWPQMLSMDIGLCELSPAPVFKTRADLRLDPSTLEAIATTPGYLDLGVSDGAVRVFRRRVWSPWFELTTPFYLSDECLFGDSADLARLVNYDESYSLRYGIACGITHYRRFVHPFRAATDLFEPFLDRYTNTGLGEPHRWDRVRSLLDDDAYLRCLAGAYAVYGSHFRIGAPDGAITFRDWSSGVPDPSRESFGASFETDRAGLPSGHLFCRDDAWLHSLLAGELPRDHAGDRFAEAIDGVRRSGLRWSRPLASLALERTRG